jgi:hypothetical protein
MVTRSVALRALALVALLLAAPALAADKIQGNMVNTGPASYDRDACFGGFVTAPPSGAFLPGTAKAKFKFDAKCKGQIGLKKMSGLPLGDGLAGTGDEIICMVNFIDSAAGSCVGFILRGEVQGNATSQKMKIKFAGASDLPGVCPPPPNDRVHVTSVECYEPEPTLTYTASGACATAGGTFVPFASDPSQGLCVLSGTWVPNPPTPILAVQGVLF